MYHMLTDFFGANEFLKYILRCYLHLAEGTIDISADTVALDLSDLRDPYDLYGDIHSADYRRSWINTRQKAGSQIQE